MGFFEDIGYISEKTSLIDRIKILIVSYPKIIYGLRLGLQKHKFAHKFANLQQALDELDKEVEESISRISAREFKLYAQKVEKNGGLIIDDTFWTTYPQVDRYVNSDQDDFEEHRPFLPWGKRSSGKESTLKTTLYFDFHRNLSYVISKLNSGVIPIEFIAGDRINNLEIAIIEKNPTSDLWINISDSYWKDGQIENAIYAFEEAFWLSNEISRLSLLTGLRERLNSIKSDILLVKYYQIFLNGLETMKQMFQMPLDEKMYHDIYDLFIKLPHFRLKTRIILTQLFFEITGDSIEILRKCEDMMYELVIWGAKEIDLAPFVRDTIRVFYSKQEHEAGVSVALDNLNLLKKFQIFKNDVEISHNLKLELAKAFSFFNKNKIAREMLESVPKPELQNISSCPTTEQFSALIRYCTNYGILLSQLKNDSSFLKELVEVLKDFSKASMTEINQEQAVISHKPPGGAVKIKTGVIILLGSLTEYLDLIDIDVHIEKIFDIVDKSPLEVQLQIVSAFMFGHHIFKEGNWQIKLTTIPVLRSKLYQLTLNLISKSYQDILALSKKRNHQIYLTCLLRLFIIVNEDPTKLTEIVKILEDQISSLALIRETINETMYPTWTMYSIWVEIFRNISNHNLILDKLIDKLKTVPGTWIALMFLRICSIRLLAESKNSKALQLYTEILEEVWNYKDSTSRWENKFRFLNKLIEIIPFFGLSLGSRLLEENYSRWQEISKNLETPINFINEIIISISDAASKLEGDAGVPLRLMNDVINVSGQLLKEDRELLNIMFDGLELLTKEMIKIPASPSDLIPLYYQLAQMAQNFLDSHEKKVHSYFPVKLLLTISYALEILGENTSDILEVAFKNIESMPEHNLNEMIEYSLMEIADESGSQRYLIIEKCMEIISLQNKSSKHATIDFLNKNIMMLIYVITHSEHGVISAIKYQRGLEENDVRRELVKILGKIDRSY